MSKNTHLVLDESMMTTRGQLQPSGVRAVSALFNLIKTQCVSYDFKMYQLNYESDVPVLTIAEKESLLPVRYVLNNYLYFNITINSRATLLYVCNLIK